MFLSAQLRHHLVVSSLPVSNARPVMQSGVTTPGRRGLSRAIWHGSPCNENGHPPVGIGDMHRNDCGRLVRNPGHPTGHVKAATALKNESSGIETQRLYTQSSLLSTNFSTASAAKRVWGVPQQSSPSPAGFAARPHSAPAYF